MNKRIAVVIESTMNYEKLLVGFRELTDAMMYLKAKQLENENEEITYHITMVMLKENQKKEHTCKWWEQYDYNIWETECGLEWETIDGRPKENHMNYCPKCGGEIIEIEIPKED